MTNHLKAEWSEKIQAWERVAACLCKPSARGESYSDVILRMAGRSAAYVLRVAPHVQTSAMPPYRAVALVRRGSAHPRVCAEVLKLAANLVDTAIAEVAFSGARDPKILGLALLCRSISNCQGALAMARDNQAIESPRSCSALYREPVFRRRTL